MLSKFQGTISTLKTVSVHLSEMLVTAYETKYVSICYTIPLIPTTCLAKFGHADLISVKYCVRLFIHFK
jgi:Na+-translocating ferredoxin:NAD+ oxidoreductase RnfE subunit